MTPEEKRKLNVVVVIILRCRWEKVALNIANKMKIEPTKQGRRVSEQKHW